MFRIIKRSPWIALGAAGAWFLDPVAGAQRRSMIATKARQWKDDLTSTVPPTPPVEQEPFGATGAGSTDEFADPDFDMPALDAERLAGPVATLFERFAAEDVELYLACLLAMDPDVWHGLAGILAGRRTGS